MVFEMDSTVALIFILAGIITGFLGKKLLRIGIGIIGGGLLAYATYKLGLMFGVEGTSLYVLAGLSFIIGYFLAWFIIKLALGVVTGIGVGLLIANLFGFMNNIPLLILTVLISIGIMYLLADKIIAIVVAVLGTLLVFVGAYYFTGLIGGTIIAVLFFFFLAYWKLFR